MSANTIGGIVTDLSSSPYYDDFNESKNFHRLLFKPSLAVQARELTQLQTILNNQTKRFAEHIFDEGTIVHGGKFTFPSNLQYVVLNDTNASNTEINVSSFANTLLTGSNVSVTAYVYDTVTGVANTSTPKTFILKYLSTGSDNSTKTFITNETLTSNTGYTAVVSSANNNIGKSSYFEISSGMLFAKGNFIKFDDQKIMLSEYTNTPSCTVGFEVSENITTYNDDYTLLDPAQGSYNYAAPGADRLKLTCSLAKYDLGANTSLNFVELFQIKDGVVQESYSSTSYSDIMDALALRTYDQSGDFYTKGLNVRVREHLLSVNNLGYLSSSNGGNNELLAIGVESGKAYVKGYGVEKLVTSYVTTKKGLDYKNIDNQDITANYGNYILVKELVGFWDVNIGSIISLYDTAQQRISTKKWSTSAQTGSLIGTARLKDIEYVSGTKGTVTATYKIYLYDIKMSTSEFKNVRSLYINNTTKADAGADAILTSGNCVLNQSLYNIGVYPLSTVATRTIRNSSDVIDNSFEFIKSFDVSVALNGTFNISTGATDETFIYSVGTLNSDQVETFNLVLNGSTNVTLPGTVSTTSGNTTILGSSTFFNRLNSGDKIEITGVTGTFIVDNITSDTNMSVLTAPGDTVSGASYTKNYFTGDIIDMTLKGADTGSSRTVIINSSTSASFDLKETLNNSVSASLICHLSKVNGKEIKKTLKPNRFVKFSCASSNTSGPFDLGFSDVFKLKYVRKSSSSFTSETDGEDVTNYFTFDNGQRDSFYDHATLIPKGISLANTDYLLAKIDYFSPDYSQGSGYFSVDSYPIDDVNGSANTNAIRTELIPIYTSSITSNSYNLRDCIDTRPVKESTANDSTTIAGASVNPTLTDTFQYSGSSLRTPVPNSNFIMSYSYYLSRKDLVLMDKTGSLRMLQGTPALIPMSPDTPSDSMTLATLSIPPYPSLASNYASSINRNDLAVSINKTANKVYTMRDVGLIDSRVSNLEYYTSLSLLESNTLNMTITDSNGLNRYKNGIFVDAFKSHSYGDLGNADFKIAMDQNKGEIRPLFEKDIVSYDYVSGSGVTNNNGVVTLTYTEQKFAEQPFATDLRNASGYFWYYKGNVQLIPASDYWTDTDTLPDLQVSDASLTDSYILNTTYGTVWNDWQTYWSGTTSTNETTSTSLTTSSTNTSLGDRVVNVSVIEYMRSIPVLVYVYGMKPNTKIYPFFDSEYVGDYMTPTDSSYVSTNVEGSDLITNSNGVFYGIFRIPNDASMKFRTGSKSLKFTDALNNGSGAITTAETTFTSQGLTQQVQTTYLTTTTVTYNTPTVSETTTTSINDITTISTSDISSNGGNGDDPIAETFLINLNSSISAIFLSSIDLFFQSKDSNLGFTLQLRELDSSGNITKNIIPYSEVHVPSSSVNISSDGSVATNVKFNSLICLTNGKAYAFVIKPDQNNPNYRVWTAVLGNTDLITNTRVTQQPYVGDLMLSSNNTSWSLVANEDIKFVLYYAKFNTGTGTFTIGNKHVNYLNVTSPTGSWNTYSEKVYGESRLTLGSISGGTISTGQLISGNSSNSYGSVTNINGSVYRITGANKENMTNENVTIKYANGLVTGVTATITNIDEPYGTLYKYKATDSSNITMVLNDCSGTFVTGEIIMGKNSGDYATISSFNDKKYSTIDFESSYLEFNNNAVNWTMKNTSNTHVLDTTWNSMVIKDNNNLPDEKLLMSRENEITYLSSNRSLQNYCQISSSDPYTSPVIDLNRTYSIVVHNILNNDTTNETEISGGNAWNKYISQKITLADGQDAEDLRVYLTCHRPPGSDVIVYVKLVNGEDSETFTNKNWIQMDDNNTLYSSAENVDDLKEYMYTLPTSMMTGSSGEVQYQNGLGVTFTGFKYYQIKIVLIGTDSAKVPRASELRAICLQI